MNLENCNLKMRFKIELEVLKHNTDNLLPLNYQYELSSWIYKVLNQGDPGFAKWLHSKGYGNNKKRFKLFTFSNLKVDKYKIHADRLKILSPKVILYISFYPLEAITPFITGLFNNQAVTIGDKISKVNFIVRSVENQNEPVFTDEMEFCCISPVIISYIDKDKEKSYADYLHPKGEKFNELFINNLVRKFNVFYKKKINPDDIDFNLEITSTPKSRLITIKAFTTDESKLKGYIFNFKIKAPEKLIRLGYYAGFGEKNSLGFGCVEVVD